MAPIPLSYTLAVVFLISVFFSCDGFSLKGFCAVNCPLGRGGNVCKCNGFHFAGKRGPNVDSNVYSNTARTSKGGNFLNLDSNGFGMFGYPKEEGQRRNTGNTNTAGQFQKLLAKYLSERYGQEDQLDSNPDPQPWQD